MLLLWTLLCGIGAAVALVVEHYALLHWRLDGSMRPLAYILGTATLFAWYAVWALLAPANTSPITTVLSLFIITAVGGAADVGAYARDHMRGRSV